MYLYLIYTFLFFFIKPFSVYISVQSSFFLLKILIYFLVKFEGKIFCMHYFLDVFYFESVFFFVKHTKSNLRIIYTKFY